MNVLEQRRRKLIALIARASADLYETEAQIARTLPQRRVAEIRRVDQALDGITPATIRKWAAANGHDCANRGRVPQQVVNAYIAAHEGGA